MKKKLFLISLAALFLIFFLPANGFAKGKFKISVPNKTMEYGTTQKVKKTNAGKSKVTYKSSNIRVAIVDKNGKITPKFTGTVKITAKAGKQSSTVTIKVIHKVTDLKILLKNNTVYFNMPNPVGLSYKVKPKSPGLVATYQISNPSIARVDKAGKITALKEGKTTLTVKVGFAKKSIPITVKRGKVSWAKFDRSTNGATPLTWSTDGRMLNYESKILDSANGKIVKTFSNLTSIRFYSGGFGVIENRDAVVKLYDNKLEHTHSFSNELISQNYKGGKSYCYTSGGDIIFTSYEAGLVRVDSKTGYVKENFDFGDRLISPGQLSVELSKDEQTLLVVHGNEIFLFDMNTGKLKDSLKLDTAPYKFEMSPDGGKVAVMFGGYGSGDEEISGKVRIIDLATRNEPILPLENGDRVLRQLTYSPNGKYFAVGGRDGEIHIYSTRDYSIKKTLSTPFHDRIISPNADKAFGVTDMAFSPDSGRLIVKYDSETWDEVPNLVMWNLPELK